jgi:hypothetical protein
VIGTTTDRQFVELFGSAFADRDLGETFSRSLLDGLAIRENLSGMATSRRAAPGGSWTAWLDGRGDFTATRHQRLPGPSEAGLGLDALVSFRTASYKRRMGRQAAVSLYVLALVAVVVSVDVLFFRNRFWERLMVNVGIVLVFAAFYLRFLKRP